MQIENKINNDILIPRSILKKNEGGLYKQKTTNDVID